MIDKIIHYFYFAAFFSITRPYKYHCLFKYKILFANDRLILLYAFKYLFFIASNIVHSNVNSILCLTSLHTVGSSAAV